MVTALENKVENPEVYRALEELEKSISNTGEEIADLEIRLKGVFRVVGEPPSGVDASNPIQPFTAPLAQEIKNHENRVSDLRDKISEMLLRLEI
jgi:hypothetical protein